MPPFAALPVPARSQQLDAKAWRTAHYDYVCATSRYRRFIHHQYRPACARMEAELQAHSKPHEVRMELFKKHRIQEMEEQGMSLRSRQMKCIRALIATPAPNLQAFSAKLEIAFRDIFLDQDDYKDVVAELLADACRLI